ncbi:Nn.00g034220.m01.CDS01 [Neocucurbitaria sp. VM-36]
MPPKRKDFLKPKPKGKAKAQEPQSENDFLEAADEFEQAAGKWRAGDAAKATRFFNRAIDMYNEGLKRYPRSFDLAYNKANLEYNITEDERIVSQLGNRTALLEETLNSHRFAISLNPTNTDISFNAAQVLTSLAEALLEAGTQAGAKYEARPLLEEAVDIFTRCLEIQQQEYAQMQDEIAKAQASGEYQEAWEGERQQTADTQQEEDMDAASSSSDAPGDWATVEEPVTPETILETCTAQLGALTTLLGLYDPNTDISSIEKKAQDGLETASSRVPALIELVEKSTRPKNEPEQQSGPTLSIGSASAAEVDTTPTEDAILAAANFQASIAEAMYRSGRSTSTTYAQAVEQTFSSLIGNARNGSAPSLASINTQSAYADALMDLASALADNAQYTTSTPAFSTDIEVQWTALAQAQTLLTQLSASPYTSFISPSRLADIFLARGDIDLFRFRISLMEAAKPAWTKSGAVLVANAGVFYRGARTYAEKAGATEVQRTADTKAVVAEILKEMASGSATAKEHWKGKSTAVVKILEQMVEEGIVERQTVESILRLAG